MNEDSARVLAHLATVETGLPASYAAHGRDAWMVLIRDDLEEVRITEPAAYVVWRDRRRGPLPPAAKRSKVARTATGLGWLLAGLLGLAARVVGAMYAGDRNEWQVRADMQQGINDSEARGYGYRQTHRRRPGL